MNRSESIANLAGALAKAQGQMESAKKDSTNPFFKSKYADLASVIDAIKKPFSTNGLSYSQDAETEEGGAVVVETIIMHESGEWKSSRLRMLPVKSDPQGIGTCITYARRYGLQAAAGVPAEDDDGNAASGNAQPDKNPADKAFSARHKPVDGAMESLLPDDQNRIRDIAIEVIAMVASNDVIGANNFIGEAGLDADEKVALWSQLDSKVRSALKKAASASV